MMKLEKARNWNSFGVSWNGPPKTVAFNTKIVQCWLIWRCFQCFPTSERFPHFWKPHFEFRSPCFRTCGAFIWKPRSGKNLRQSQAVSQAMWPLLCQEIAIYEIPRIPPFAVLTCFKYQKQVEICWDVWKQLTLRAHIPECPKDVGWSTPKRKTARNPSETHCWRVSVKVLDLSGKLKGCRNAQNRWNFF